MRVLLDSPLKHVQGFPLFSSEGSRWPEIHFQVMEFCLLTVAELFKFEMDSLILLRLSICDVTKGANACLSLQISTAPLTPMFFIFKPSNFPALFMCSFKHVETWSEALLSRSCDGGCACRGPSVLCFIYFPLEIFADFVWYDRNAITVTITRFLFGSSVWSRGWQRSERGHRLWEFQSWSQQN